MVCVCKGAWVTAITLFPIRIFIGAAAASDAMSASDSEASFASFAICHLPRLRSEEEPMSTEV